MASLSISQKNTTVFLTRITQWQLLHLVYENHRGHIFEGHSTPLDDDISARRNTVIG
jgi:hypothetical protein